MNPGERWLDARAAASAARRRLAQVRAHGPLFRPVVAIEQQRVEAAEEAEARAFDVLAAMPGHHPISPGSLFAIEVRAGPLGRFETPGR